MNPRHYALTLALALAAGFAGHALTGKLWTPTTVEARQDDDDGRRWEYCAVTRAQFPGSPRGGSHWIVYFRGGGVQVTTVEAGVSENAQAKAILRLGEDGWEMVGEGPLDVRQVGPGSTPTALFFKRRKE